MGQIPCGIGLPPFAGHSLGGAVATLCAIRLLSQLPARLHHMVAAVGFATPPVGNSALAEEVAAASWADRIVNYTLPGQKGRGIREWSSRWEVDLARAVLPMLLCDWPMHLACWKLHRAAHAR